MSSAIDRALMELSIQDEEEAVDIPDLPQFSSRENNRLSLIGRILNPACQSVTKLIQNLPRKWEVFNRVRGIALTNERFQFIFQNEDEMEGILNQGFHTFNEWGIALERWSPNPTDDFLQSVKIWVQMRDIPLNNYTEETVMFIGDIIGKVKEVAFDKEKSQSREYVRALIEFEVSAPLSKARVFNLPRGGGKARIRFHYERVQKRCYTCQRLIHEREKCPLYLRSLEQDTLGSASGPKKAQELILKPSDPLFGVLKEEQVGKNPLNGRPKIAPEVLEGMRQYLMVVNDDERMIREERIKKSLADIQNDFLAQKSMLSLEPIPVVTMDVDKGKGLVFDYSVKEHLESREEKGTQGEKLMSSAIKAGSIQQSSRSSPFVFHAEVYRRKRVGANRTGSTGVGSNLLVASSSGTKSQSLKPRRRPGKRNRLQSNRVGIPDQVGPRVKDKAKSGDSLKRRVPEGELVVQDAVKRINREVVPKEGLPESQ